MLHFAGRNDLKRANVPPARQHSTCLYDVTHQRIMTCMAMCGTTQYGGHTAMSTATGWRHTIHCAGCHNVVPRIAQLEYRGGDCCHACGEAQPHFCNLSKANCICELGKVILKRSSQCNGLGQASAFCIQELKCLVSQQRHL